MKFLNLFGETPNLSALARPYRWTAFVMMLLAVAISLLEGFGVSLLIPLLSTFTDNQALVKSGGVLGQIARFAGSYTRNQRFLIVASVILACLLLKGAVQVLANTFASWVDGRIGHDIRCALSERLHYVSHSFFLVQEPARLLDILATESWKTSEAVRVLLSQIAALAAVLVFSILLLAVNWRLSLFVLAGGLLVRKVQTRTEAKLRERSQLIVSTTQVLYDRMLFTIFGSRIIRLFHQQQTEQRRFKTASTGARIATLKLERLSGIQSAMLEAMHGSLLAVIMLAAAFTGVSLPVLATFIVLMNRVQPHLRVLEQSGAAFASATGRFSEVEWLLDSEGKPSVPKGQLAFTGLRNAVEFDNVTYEYGDRGEPVLQGANFRFRRGRSTAVIGASGAGKSTVVNLLCRLMEPVSGTIKVDGQPLSRIKLSDWLNAIAVAGQDIDLVDGTIAENVSYGRPNTERTKIQQALRAAAADFVNDLPQGLDTLVGPHGLALSGGERQRIGLARALAREPDILILDEATNAIDWQTESSIVKTLQNLPKSMTIIVISHKPHTLAFCDDAVVLDQGRLVETGPFSSILSFGTIGTGTAGDTVTGNSSELGDAEPT